MKAKVKDWNSLLGKDVRVKGRNSAQAIGSLCGHETDGNGGISVFRVAFAPAVWGDFKAEDVELVTP